MSDMIRVLGAVVVLCGLSACQVTGAAPPASQQTTGINSIGAPGSGAP